MRFVQFADTHLDTPISGALGLPPDKKASLRADIRTAFRRACSLAVERQADLVLLPGDLFDYEAGGSDTGEFIAEALRQISPIRVFITPGNHDSLRPRNPYLADENPSWPDNVHIFKSQRFESVIVEELGCCVTGIAHAHRGVTDRLLAQHIERPEADIELMLLHGSRDSYAPSDKETVIPFSDQELLAQGFTYTALGHYHSYSQIDDADGNIRAAYSGCLQGRGLDETGEKYALVGEIDDRGHVELEKVEVAPRRILTLDVDVSGAPDLAAAWQKVEPAMQQAGVRECDIARAVLTGTVPDPENLRSDGWKSRANCFHLRVDASRVEPDYDLEALAKESAADTLRSAFVRRMDALKADARDDEERRMLADAVYYGLYALDGKKLEPRDAD